MGPGQDHDDDSVEDEGHGEEKRHDHTINGLYQVQGPQPGAGID